MATAAPYPRRRSRYCFLVALISTNALLILILTGTFVYNPLTRLFPRVVRGLGVCTGQRSEASEATIAFEAIARKLQRPLRVAIVTHELTRSGAAMMCLELAAMLERRGAQVSVVVLCCQIGTALPMSQEISPGHKFRVIEGGSKLIRRYNASQYDVIVASSATAVTVQWLERFRGRVNTFGRLLWWIHEGPAVMREFIPKFRRKAADALRLGLADGLVFESWHSAQFWLQHVSHNRTSVLAPFSRVIHWGLPDKKFASLACAAAGVPGSRGARGKRQAVPVVGVWPRTLLARRGPHLTDANPAVRVFVMVGNGNPRKGYEAAFEATRIANDQCGERAGGPRVFLLGVGVTAESAARDAPAVDLYTLAEQYDGIVELVGGAGDPTTLLAASDAFISNGIHGGENFGLSLMEAMATGTPVLATRAGGATEQIVHDVHGFLVDSGEVIDPWGLRVLSYDMHAHARALSRAMCVVVSDPARARRWGSAGQLRVQAYLSEGRIMGEFGRLVASLLQLPDRDPTTALPAEETRGALVPLALQGASMWEPRSHAGGGNNASDNSPARSDWVATTAAAAVQQFPPVLTAPSHKGRPLQALLGRHAAFVLAPAEPRSDVDSAPPLGLFAVDSATLTVGNRALLHLDSPEFPRAGVGMSAMVLGGGESAVIVAGGVGEIEDPCARPASSPAWLFADIDSAALDDDDSSEGNGAAGVGITRLPDLPVPLIRPVVVVVQSSETAPSGAFAVHVLGGTRVGRDEALSGLHWRLEGSFPPTTDGAASPPPPRVRLASAWERSADIPLPTLDPAVVADGAGGAIYWLGGRIGGPPDPSAVPPGECVPDRPTSGADGDDEAGAEGADASGNATTMAQRPLLHPLYGAAAAHPLPLAMSSALRFDAATGTWTRVADLPVPVWDAVTVMAAGGRVVVLGGRMTGGDLTDAVQQYVPEDDRWHVIGAVLLPAPSAGGVAWLGYVKSSLGPSETGRGGHGMAWLGYVAAPSRGDGVAPVLSVVYAPTARADCRVPLRHRPSINGTVISGPDADAAASMCTSGLRPWPRGDLPGVLMQLELVVSSPVLRPSGRARRRKRLPGTNASALRNNTVG